MQVTRSKWFMPVFSLLLGLIVAAAELIGGRPGDAVFTLVVMIALAALFLFGGASETIRGLRGDGRDERFRSIDLRATAFAGTALIVAVLTAFVVSLLEGHDGRPYDWLAAVAGLAYIAGVAWFRIRG